jgi:uridylate kinase
MATAPRRILLKLSGEAFKGPEGAFSPRALERIAGEIAPVSSGIALAVGAGNIVRGARSELLDRIEADTLGMLATVLNALALRTYLEARGRRVVVQSAVSTELTDVISPRGARRALDQGAVVIFAGGTGSPLVTTDTAAALRAVSVGADLLAKASNVDGIYSRDPASDPTARRLSEVSFDEFLTARYGVMDQVAVEICREHNLPVEVFDFEKPGALAALAAGRRVGTRIHAS